MEGERLTFVDRSRPAAARTHIAENQECRGTVAPALANIWTARLFTYRVQVFFAHEALQPKVVGITRRFDFDPIGMSARHGLRSSEFGVSSFESVNAGR